MKNRLLIIAIMLSTILLCGCTTGVTLTNEQNEAIAQYVAGSLYTRTYSFLNKHPDYNQDNPVEEETTTEEETAIIPADSTTAEDQTSGEEETTKAPMIPDFDVAAALSIEPAKVTYVSNRTSKEYPDDEDAVFTMEAEQGYVYMVVTLQVTNPSDQDINLNTYVDKPVFHITFPDEKYYSNHGSLALNDLSNLKDFVIQAGEQKECILLFMINEEYADKTNEFVLSKGNITLDVF